MSRLVIVHRGSLLFGTPYLRSFRTRTEANEWARAIRGDTTRYNARVVSECTKEWVVYLADDTPVETKPAPFTETKPALSNIPPSAMEGLLRVASFGNTKYKPGDWLPGQPNARPAVAHINAAFRHILRHLAGETHDAESGLPHLDHAAMRIIMARETDARTRGK